LDLSGGSAVEQFRDQATTKLRDNSTLDVSSAARQRSVSYSAISERTPLYTFKTILGTAEAPSDPATVLGPLSLVLWTLFIVTTVKYVLFAMRVDNGERGILVP